MFADLRRQRCLGVDHRDVFLVEDGVVDSALNPLIAFGLWNRSKVNAVPSNKVEHIVFDSISKMKTIRAEGNAFDVSSLNNTDLCSNETLAHEMKEFAKLLNIIDTNVEFVCQDLQALWADSEHGPREKMMQLWQVSWSDHRDMF